MPNATSSNFLEIRSFFVSLYNLLILKLVFDTIFAKFVATGIANNLLTSSCERLPFFFFTVPVVLPKVLIWFKDWHLVNTLDCQTCHHWNHLIKTPSWDGVSMHHANSCQCLLCDKMRLNGSQRLECPSLERYNIFSI